MPLFMDRHDVPGATAADVAQAHTSDLEKSAEFGVEFFSYWFDSDSSSVFCFAKAPSEESLAAVHRSSHGLVPNEIIPVSEDNVLRFLGKVQDPAGPVDVESPFRTVLFTDLVGSTSLMREMGEASFMPLLTEHDLMIRRAVVAFHGREVKYTGDGFLLCFDRTRDALMATLQIQREFASWRENDGVPMRVRIGMTAGEPVDHNDDLFGSAVNLASRLCDEAAPDQILCADVVYEIGSKEHFRFTPAGERSVKGFDQPVPVFVLEGQPSH